MAGPEKRVMTSLFDTDGLLLAAIKPESLSRRAREFIANTANRLLVSAASAWEISTKVRTGQLAIASDLERNFLSRMQEAGYEVLPIEASVALRAGRMAGAHGDPFDRMIAAQALELDFPVIGSDAQLDSFGVQRIW